MSSLAHLLQNLYERRGIKPGLRRIRCLLREFGVEAFPFQVVHVAGTNGKGSTSMMTARILQESGHKTGLYLSPHLQRVNERISINGLPIPDRRLFSLIRLIDGRIRRSASGVVRGTTFFEFFTLLGILYFCEQKVEWAVFETGMGGRLDATNVFPSRVCVVTGIGNDHREYLGYTRKEIAREKFAILKPGAALVTGEKRSFVQGVLGDLRKKTSRLYCLGQDFISKDVIQDQLDQSFCYEDKEAGFSLPISLQTPFDVQRKNSALAIKAAFEALRGDLDIPSFSRAAARALGSVRLPGRFQIVRKEPFLIIDAAHNGDAAAQLAQSILRLDTASDWCIILGVLRDKDFRKMFFRLKEITKDFILVPAESERGMLPHELACRLRGLSRGCRVREAPSVKDALLMEKGLGRNILVCGSFTVAGPALTALRRLKF